MAQSYRSRHLAVMAANERAMRGLFAQLAESIAAEVTRRADGDGVIDRPETLEILRLANEKVTNFFLGYNRQGKRAPFEVLPNGQVFPLSPFMRQLWAAISAAVQIPVEQNAAYLVRRLPPDILVAMRQAKVDPFVAGQAQVREQIFRPNPLADYDAPHQWIDPNGYRLSDRVWNTTAHTRQQIDLYLETAIREGRGALAITRELAQFLTPGEQLRTTNKPYGSTASFSAMRLARTEITHAQLEASRVSAAMNPFVAGMKWNLSAAHPKVDICDAYARGGPEGNGVYPIGSYPVNPHPNCMCYPTNALTADPDEILDELRKDIRRERAELVDKIGPVAVEKFTAMLLGETPAGVIPPVVAPTPVTPPVVQPIPTVPPRVVTPPPAPVAPPPTTIAPPVVEPEPAPSGAVPREYQPDPAMVERAMQNARRGIEALAAMEGVTPTEYERDVRAAVADLMVGKPIQMQLPSGVIDQLIESKRFKSQFETATRGPLDVEERADGEFNGMGLPKNLDPRRRPIYGYVKSFDGQEEIVGELFGDLTFVVKNQVRPRTDYTVGDSLFDFVVGNTVSSPLDEVRLESLGSSTRSLYRYTQLRKQVGHQAAAQEIFENIAYIEVQIREGLNLSEVSKVVDHKGNLSNEQIKKLQGLGIEVEVKVTPAEQQAARVRAEAGAKARAEAEAKARTEEEARRVQAEREAVEASRRAQEAIERQRRQEQEEQEKRRLQQEQQERERVARLERQRLENEARSTVPRRATTPVESAANVRKRILALSDANQPRIDALNQSVTQLKTDVEALSKRIEKLELGGGKRTEAQKAADEAAIKRHKDDRFALNQQIVAGIQESKRLQAENNEKITALLVVPNPASVTMSAPGVAPELAAQWQTGFDTFNRFVSADVAPRGTIVARRQDSQANHYDASDGTINLNSRISPSVVAHELVHWLGNNVPEFLQKEIAFLERRTAGEETRPFSESAPHIVGRRDKFMHRYMGREYIDPYTGRHAGSEIGSMGLQYMIDKPAEFAREDPDMFDFIYNLLRGL